MQISATTKLFAVIGYPVAHSLSPVMHNAAFQAVNLDCCYVALEVSPQQLATGVKGLGALGFQGFNVTIPHKESIVEYLDHVEADALLSGAVNTVVINDGKLTGLNTDGKGLLRALDEEWGFNPKDQSVVVIGAGGAARAIVASLARAGANHITIGNRNQERALALKHNIEGHTTCALEVVDLQGVNLDTALRNCSLVIQTTPLGMHPCEDDWPIDPARLKPGTFVYDIIFNPQETKFLRGARERGCKTANGLGMLLHQGALAFEAWTGVTAPLDVMRAALLKK